MKILLACFLAATLVEGNVIVHTVPSDVPATSAASYTCGFTNRWSARRHPFLYPFADAHWSAPLIVAHDKRYTMWEEGRFASEGVQLVAEVGFMGPLVDDFLAGSLNFVLGRETFNRVIQTQTFNPIVVTPKHHYLSSITMIVPSPDWFSGFSKVDTIDKDGNWLQEVTIETAPFDAGTEDGEQYSLNNSPTNPRNVITRFTTSTAPKNGVFLNSRGDDVLPVVSWKCTLNPVEEAERKTPKEPKNLPAFDVKKTDSRVPSSQLVSYQCQFKSNWSLANHPIMYPTKTAQWTPPVLVAHTDGYTMWSKGNTASKGVEKVAETGDTSILEAEFDASSQVFSAVIGSGMASSETLTQTFANVLMGPSSHYMSTITSVAPSPDWFTGFYGVDFVNKRKGTWYDTVVISTYPWDAGTENGDTYKRKNAVTSPKEPITRFGPSTAPSTGVFLNKGKDDVLPVGIWSCKIQT